MRSACFLCLSLLTSALSAAPGQAAPQLAQTPLSTDRLLDTVSGLILVVVVILAAAWLLRRFGHLPGLGKGVIRILGGVSLGTRERAMLIEVQGDRLLIGVAPGQVRTLHVWPGAAQSADEDFAQSLAQAARPSAEEST